MGRVLSSALALSVALLVGCGAKESSFPDTFELEPSERLLRTRAALSSVKAEPDAKRLQLEIARAEAWLNRAEFLLNSGKDGALRDELLLTAEGQISAVQAELARMRVRPLPPSDSESSLEDQP